MFKKNKNFLIIFSIVLVLFFTTSCNKEEKGMKETLNEKYDYLVLVNKYSKLPDDWESNVELVSAKDAWGENIKIEKKTYENYKKLKKALEKDGVTIELDSVYRSIKEQQKLWDDWTVEKGIDYVKKYVAVPGFSEHHTGLAVDICLRKDGKLIYENDDMIADRETFAKIHAKLADYGFILRYLENRDDITGYAYEPWHLRYIGDSKIAKKIMDKDITFEEYLESVENVKETPSSAKYHVEKALQKHFVKVYGDKIIDVKFNVTKVYSSKEEKETEVLKSMNLGKKDIAFEVTYQLLPAENVNIIELMIPNGEFDQKSGWIIDVSRVGVLKYSNGNYSIKDFGTGF